jgi:hypothetical protein
MLLARRVSEGHPSLTGRANEESPRGVADKPYFAAISFAPPMIHFLIVSFSSAVSFSSL